MTALPQLAAPLSPSYAVRLSEGATSSPSLSSSTASPLRLSVSSSARSSQRSSLGAPPSLHRLRVTRHTSLALNGQAALLSSPAGSELSLTPSLSSSPLPCSPSPASLGQENVHPNVADLGRRFAGLSVAASAAERKARAALSPALSEVLKPSTPAASLFPRPVKRLSFHSASSALHPPTTASLPAEAAAEAAPVAAPTSTTASDTPVSSPASSFLLLPPFIAAARTAAPLSSSQRPAPSLRSSHVRAMR